MQWSLEQEMGEHRLEKALRFGAALRSFWQVRGYFREGRIFLERVLAQSEGGEISLRAQALNDAVLLAVSQGDHTWGGKRGARRIWSATKRWEMAPPLHTPFTCWDGWLC